MNMIERGRTVVQKLRGLARKSAWDWRQCSYCHGTWTRKNGGYWRYPWTLRGHEGVRIQRHWCYACARSYPEEQAWLVRGSWYGREVHRCAVDQWVHGRSSLRRVAQFLRSLMGRQERWWLWRVWEERVAGPEECHFHHSTVQR